MGCAVGNESMHTLVVHATAEGASCRGWRVIPKRGGGSITRPPNQSEVPPVPAKDRPFQGGVGARVDFFWPMAGEECVGPKFVAGGKIGLPLMQTFHGLKDLRNPVGGVAWCQGWQNGLQAHYPESWSEPFPALGGTLSVSVPPWLALPSKHPSKLACHGSCPF